MSSFNDVDDDYAEDNVDLTYLERNGIGSIFFVTDREMEQSEEVFRSVYKMSKGTFIQLVHVVGPVIEKQNTKVRQRICIEERMLITLRYLSTGSRFWSLAEHFRKEECSIARVVSETTRAIWQGLKDSCLPVPTADDWKDISRKCSEEWFLPNCLGAIYAKQIRIRRSFNATTGGVRDVGRDAIILMAVCDSDGYLVSIDCNFARRNRNGRTLSATALGDWLSRDGRSIPTADPLPYDETGNRFPYYFVGDASFPLRAHLMRPYGLAGNVTEFESMFNFKLSRGINSAQNVFRSLMRTFRVYRTFIATCKYSTVISIIKCSCVLFNFIKKSNAVHPANGINSRPDERHLPNFMSEVDFSNSPTGLQEYLANYFSEVALYRVAGLL